MVKTRRSKGGRAGGRTTLGPCEYLSDDRVCEPLNTIWLLNATGKVTKRYGACSCGRRFGPSDVARDLPEAAAAFLEEPPTPGAVLDDVAVAEVVAGLWPADQESEWARDGVVPVGQAVLHEPTGAVDATAGSLTALAERMLATQEGAEGVGLAANQVGGPIRVLAHNFPRIAPPIFLNPSLLDARDEWDYEEACLSLHLEDTAAEVRRPKVVVVHTELLDGSRLVIEADELFARVLQHELDHLVGIEYVQRLTGRTARRVYRTMADAGIDTDRWLPLRPY